MQNRPAGYLPKSYAWNSSDVQVFKVSSHHLKELWSIISIRAAKIVYYRGLQWIETSSIFGYTAWQTFLFVFCFLLLRSKY